MQNQKNYQNFVDEESSYSTGIPVGQPIRYPNTLPQQPNRQQNQNTYFQQPIGNPYQNMGQPPAVNQIQPNINQMPPQYNQMPPQI